MTFTLLEVDTAADFHEVIACQWDAYEHPFQSFFRLFCPLVGDGPAARADSIKASAALQLEWHRADPTGYWGKVVDDDSGKIVGACLWKIYTSDPFAGEDAAEDHPATWYPEGETRDYVTECLRQFDAPRKRMAKRPHVFLNILYTHPDHRRKGVADLMLNWGRKKADAMGVEMWIDAGELGVPVYKRHGFSVVNVNRVQPAPKPDAGQAWKDMDAALQPMTFWTMWRPPLGDYQDGKVTKPWE